MYPRRAIFFLLFLNKTKIMFFKQADVTRRKNCNEVRGLGILQYLFLFECRRERMWSGPGKEKTCFTLTRRR